MGRLFKQRWTRGGKTHVNKVWHCEYPGPDGGPVRASTGCRDKAAALQVLARLEREAEQVRAGLLPPNAAAARKPLADLLAAFQSHLRDQGRSAGHRKNVGVYVPRVIAACGWATLADVSAAKLAEWIRSERERVSPATVNTHLAPLKTFTRWAAEECGGTDPLRKVKLLNPDLAPTRNKYTPTPAEVAAVVAAAERSPRRRSVMSGPDRAVLYRVACYSGFRAAELASLTPESFAWAGGTPSAVTILAKDAKDRRTATVPLPAHLGAVLGPWLAARPAGERCWPGTWAAERKQSSWLKRDCKRAGVTRFTFHAFRRFLANESVRSRATVTELQRLMRHKSPVTTLRWYARASDDDLRTAVERLPCLPACLPETTGNHVRTGENGGEIPDDKRAGGRAAIAAKPPGKSRKSGSARGGT